MSRGWRGRRTALPVQGLRGVSRGKYCTHLLSARSRRNHMQQSWGTSWKRQACTALSARCLKRTQGAKDCTASRAAIHCPWALGVSQRPPGRSTYPPHCPTDPWACVQTTPSTCRLLVHGPRLSNVAHARRDCPRGSRTRPLSPTLVAHSGMREMA